MNFRSEQSLARLEEALPKLARPMAVIGIFMPGLLDHGLPEAPSLLRSFGLYRLWKHLYFSDAEVEEKFAALAEGVLSDGSQKKLKNAIWNLEKVGSVSKLMGLMKADVRGKKSATRLRRSGSRSRSSAT